MKKTYLLTPGPTPIPEVVLAAMSLPIIHHRTPAFMEIFQEVQTGIQKVFQTKQPVLLLSCTGTGGMEAAVSNLFEPGETVITLAGGKFGERWRKIAQAQGVRVIELKFEAGDCVDLSELASILQKHPEARAILFQASETSTGVKLPVKEICELARQSNILSVCDAITACGVFHLPMDEWGIDVLITGSQKAFMIPPGLSMIALSEKAWEKQVKTRSHRFYFDLAKEKKALEKNQTAWTPAISLIVGLRESLKLIHEEGLSRVYARHAHLAQATRVGVQALGLKLFVKKPEYASDAVTSVLAPETIGDAKKIVKLMRDHYGVTLVGGQDALESKILRLSHFGYCGPFDIITAIAALELALHQLGHPVTFGKATGAVNEYFSRNL